MKPGDVFVQNTAADLRQNKILLLKFEENVWHYFWVSKPPNPLLKNLIYYSVGKSLEKNIQNYISDCSLSNDAQVIIDINNEYKIWKMQQVLKK